MQEYEDRWEMTREEYKNLYLTIASTMGKDWMFEETEDRKGHYVFYRGKKLVIIKLYELGLLHYNRLEEID